MEILSSNHTTPPLDTDKDDIWGTETALNQQVGGKHYVGFAIQPVVFCHKNRLGFIESSAIKYLCRHKSKGGKEDLLKARHFIDLLIQLDYDGSEKSNDEEHF